LGIKVAKGGDAAMRTGSFASSLICISICVGSTLAVVRSSPARAETACQKEPECAFWLRQASQGTDWLLPFPPFHIIGNVYFVGSKDLGTYLIVTPKGNILINPDFDANVPMIKDSIAKLGFKYADTKILLISHAHSDHNGGAAQVIRETGAKYEVMAPDVPVVESGGKTDFHYGKLPGGLYPPAHVDRVLHDGDKVELGGTVLTALLTPGHTKGCTTWTMTAREGEKNYNVVIVGSPNINPGYRLVNNAEYPQIADDYRKTFQILKSLHADVFLGAHPDYFNGEAKYARIKAGGANPFIDPEGYKSYIAERQANFEKTLAQQQAEARK
jgi:metallo-beta-lactamase class B